MAFFHIFHIWQSIGIYSWNMNIIYNFNVFFELLTMSFDLNVSDVLFATITIIYTKCYTINVSCFIIRIWASSKWRGSPSTPPAASGYVRRQWMWVYYLWLLWFSLLGFYVFYCISFKGWITTSIKYIFIFWKRIYIIFEYCKVDKFNKYKNTISSIKYNKTSVYFQSLFVSICMYMLRKYKLYF